MRVPRLLLGAAIVTAVVAMPGVAGAMGLSVDAAPLATGTEPTTVPTKTCTLQPSGDATVTQGNQLQTLDGDTLTVHAIIGLDRHSFLRFDLAGCPVVPPTAARVERAVLALRMTTAPSGSRSHLLHRVTGPWTEAGVTWANAPAVAAQPSGTFSTGIAAPATATFDVTRDVQGFAANPASNFGWRLADAAAAGVLQSFTAGYGSSENATVASRPQLTIEWRP